VWGENKRKYFVLQSYLSALKRGEELEVIPLLVKLYFLYSPPLCLQRWRAGGGVVEKGIFLFYNPTPNLSALRRGEELEE